MLHDILLPGLEDHGFDVRGVESAGALYAALRECEFDAVVLDIGLPDADGFSVAQAVRMLLPDIGVVMLTGHGETAEQVRGLAQGADAYLVKPVHIELLAVTINSVVRRLRGAPAPACRHARWQFDPEGWSIVSPNGRVVALTHAEQRLVAVLASDVGRPVPRERLAAALADDVHAFDPHRLEMMVHRLRRKVLARCGEALPLSALHGMGYLLEDSQLEPRQASAS